MRGVGNQHLPEMICSAGGRPFAGRKKWPRDSERVLYCNQRRRRSRLSYTGVRPDEKGTLQFKAQGRT
ncbi:MAG: DUF2256 domain-containing protein [Candidatus Solibacter sp.]|nr:DUF2256 domain-containing protein [Candidatus Solibacter sp.]